MIIKERSFDYGVI